ncbi:histidine decarboxylase, pyruvoyl type [Rhizobium beringeri]
MSSIARYDGEYDPAVVVSGAIGPYAAVCGGTVGNGASGNGYVTGLKLAVGITSAAGLDEGKCRIVSGDRCRVAGTYIGQTNFLIATSYTGPRWRYLGPRCRRRTRHKQYCSTAIIFAKSAGRPANSSPTD